MSFPQFPGNFFPGFPGFPSTPAGYGPYTGNCNRQCDPCSGQQIQQCPPSPFVPRAIALVAPLVVGAAQSIPSGGGPIPLATVTVPTAAQTVQIVGNYAPTIANGIAIGAGVQDVNPALLPPPVVPAPANAGIATILVPGAYQISANVCFASGAAAATVDDIRVLYIYRATGTQVIPLATVSQAAIDDVAGTPTCLNGSAGDILNYGDRIFIGVRQTSSDAGAIPLVAGATRLSILKVD